MNWVLKVFFFQICLQLTEIRDFPPMLAMIVLCTMLPTLFPLHARIPTTYVRSYVPSRNSRMQREQSRKPCTVNDIANIRGKSRISVSCRHIFWKNTFWNRFIYRPRVTLPVCGRLRLFPLCKQITQIIFNHFIWHRWDSEHLPSLS